MDTQRLYKVTITKDEETGFFVAEVPTLSPCITYGSTIEEAIEMVKEAIEGVIEAREESGYPIPDDNEQKNKLLSKQSYLCHFRSLKAFN